MFRKDKVVVQESLLSHPVTLQLSGNDFANGQEKHSN